MSVDSLKKAIAHVKAEGKLNPRGIIAVDLFGLPANFQEISEIAKQNNMFLLEDGAQGFGGKIGDKRACSFGDVAATSFFPAKPLGCYGDGGAIFTNDDELANKINSIHIHGQGTDKYDNIRLGMNSRLDTIQAVVLDAKLDIFNEELEKRNIVAKKYMNSLKDIVEIPTVTENFYSCWAQFTVKVKPEQKREEVISKLNKANIPTAIYYPIPIHLSSAYKEIAEEQVELPNTEDISKRVFSIPMHPYITDDEIAEICKAVKDSIE